MERAAPWFSNPWMSASQPERRGLSKRCGTREANSSCLKNAGTSALRSNASREQQGVLEYESFYQANRPDGCLAGSLYAPHADSRDFFDHADFMTGELKLNAHKIGHPGHLFMTCWDHPMGRTGASMGRNEGSNPSPNSLIYDRDSSRGEAPTPKGLGGSFESRTRSPFYEKRKKQTD